MDPDLAYARDTFAHLLVDRCVIQERPDRDDGTYDEGTYTETFTAGAEIYDGPCQLQNLASVRTVDQGAAESIVDETDLAIPADVTGVRVGQLVTITRTDSPDLVNAVFHIVRAPVRSRQILARYKLRRVQSFRQGPLV